MKYKIKQKDGFPIIADDPLTGFKGLRGRIRFLQICKNRLGEPDRSIPVNFFGEIGLFREFDKKPDEIADWTKYTQLKKEDKTTDIVNENINKEIIYNF